jgi:hypothetical protein
MTGFLAIDAVPFGLKNGKRSNYQLRDGILVLDRQCSHHVRSGGPRASYVGVKLKLLTGGNEESIVAVDQIKEAAQTISLCPAFWWAGRAKCLSMDV